MNQEYGRYIILAGLALVFIGVVVYLFGDKLHWLGRLPGDIRIERENTRIYFPITTMILLSVVLSVVLWIVRWMGRS